MSSIVWVRNKRTGITFSLVEGAEHTAYVLSQADEYELTESPNAPAPVAAPSVAASSPHKESSPSGSLPPPTVEPAREAQIAETRAAIEKSFKRKKGAAHVST
jgi:hypothetical protein